MYPVFLNSNNEQYNFQSFSKRFLEICNEHLEDRRALVFAFILYDFEDAQIRKVLNDSDYWESLNRSSGEYITVFSLNYKSAKKRNIFMQESSNNSFINPSEITNNLIEKYFGNKTNINYPSVIFFQVDKNKILDYTIVELDELEIEQSFIELKNYIKKVVNELKHIRDENRGNLQAIFNNTESIAQSERWRKIAIRKIRAIIPIARFGASIGKLGR